VTVPVGSPLVPGLTVAVNVTAWPETDGSDEEKREIEDDAPPPTAPPPATETDVPSTATPWRPVATTEPVASRYFTDQ